MTGSQWFHKSDQLLISPDKVNDLSAIVFRAGHSGLAGTGEGGPGMGGGGGGEYSGFQVTGMIEGFF